MPYKPAWIRLIDTPPLGTGRRSFQSPWPLGLGLHLTFGKIVAKVGQVGGRQGGPIALTERKHLDRKNTPG